MVIHDSQLDINTSDNVSLSKQFGQYRDSVQDNGSVPGNQSFIREFTPKSQLANKEKPGHKTEQKNASIDVNKGKEELSISPKAADKKDVPPQAAAAPAKAKKK